MGVGADDPPPRLALRCPTTDGHSSIAVRDEWFYCVRCDRRYGKVVDARSDATIPHEEFVRRWGVVSYRDYRI